MNIVTATFSAGCTQIDADRKLWQYDQGQVLQLVGLDLPDSYQVEFSNSRDKGSAKAQIGGPDGVSIPDEYLTTGKPVYAFLVGHTAEEDRETEKLVVIYVNARSQPTDEPITPEQQGIVDQLIAALNAGVEKAEDAAAQAEAAIGYMPKIVDGDWWVYDAETETWADTGIQAEGQDGVGISDATLNADYTLTLTFTDGSSYTTPSIRGARGEPGPVGPTPDISIGTVTTGAAGSQAEATMTGTPERPVLNLTIPRGDPGEVTQAEFDELAEEVADQKSAIEDLQDLTNRKAGMLVDTASGSIASFTPDITIPDLLGVSVAVEPVQDLHGYDSPWPAGGGVNKLSSDNMSRFTQAAYGVQYTVQADGGITAAGTVTAITWNFSQFYTTLDAFGLSVGETLALSCFGDDVNFAIHFYADSTMLSGIDKAGTPVGVIPEGTNRLRVLVYCKASSPPTVGEVINKTIYPQLETASTPSTVWHPYSNECPISGWDAVSIWNKPTHDTTLPPTVEIQLGQTVYGGTLDVVNGTLTVDRGYVDATNKEWVKDSSGNRYTTAFDKNAEHGASRNPVLCNIGIYKSSGSAVGSAFIGTNGRFYYYPPADINTLKLFTDWLQENPIQICYPLATPIVIQLDPVTISAIAGQANNVWADTGNVSVEFAADVKTYIDQKIAAAVAALS